MAARHPSHLYGHPSRRGVLVGIVVTVAGLALLTWLGSLLPIADAVETIRASGPWRIPVAAGLFVVGTVAFVPGSLLAGTAGALFGFLEGSLVVFVGANVGALAAFLVARALGRRRLGAWLERFGALEDLDRAVGRRGFQVVVLLRFAHVPYNALNYALGLTRITLGRCLLGNLVGMLPGMAFVVYTGSLAGSAVGLRGPAAVRGPVEWTLFGVGVAASILATVLLGRFAQRAVHRHRLRSA